jgi:threonylcarbamoyladenosine tRNA methylthiotransferase MtaB
MNIYLDMVGCRLNQAEIEHMAGQFRAQGHTIVSSAGGADLVVVNTCSVTAQAASDSRQKIRQAARAGAKEILATGCWATLQPEQALQLPNVVRVIPNQEKDSLASGFIAETHPNSATPIFDLEPISRQPLPGVRQRTRAFIKVQDGCDNACTFCITTVARGAGHSRPADGVIADVRAALQGGAQEIVLTGVHLGSWGQEFNQHLRQLITQILGETNPPRLRLSSLEPWDLDEDFFALWSDPRLCAHLHLPLQSGSEGTLKRMARKTNPESFRALVQAARQQIPDLAITTDLIAGFPGETEDEFNQTLAFIQEINFAGGHVFAYSARPGTPAARIREQVPHDLRKQRSRMLHEAFAHMGVNYRQGFVGKSLPVLWEASALRNEQGWLIEGLTGNYLRVTAQAPALRWNHLDVVTMTSVTEDGLHGEINGLSG